MHSGFKNIQHQSQVLECKLFENSGHSKVQNSNYAYTATITEHYVIYSTTW